MIERLGERLHRVRIEKGLSQKEVARILGFSVGLMSNYENGERTPSLENLKSLANFYRCTTDYLLGLDDRKSSLCIDVSHLSDEQIEYLRLFIEALN